MAKGGSYTNSILLKENVKYIMTSPAIILNNLVKHSKISGYKFERLYRILFNEQMFYQAYQRIASKKGNMTSGTDGKTVDGMSIERIERLIASLRDETYKPHPAKRVYTLAQLGCNILWKMFRHGMIEHHGLYLNLTTMKVNPIMV